MRIDNPLAGPGALMPARPRRPLVVGVDNDPGVCSALRRAFRAEPFDFVTTESPREALDWVRRRRVALLISDQRMPEMSGTDLLRAAAECSPRTRLLMITGYPELDLVERCGPGTLAIVAKPWSDDVLRRLVENLIGPAVEDEIP